MCALGLIQPRIGFTHARVGSDPADPLAIAFVRRTALGLGFARLSPIPPQARRLESRCDGLTSSPAYLVDPNHDQLAFAEDDGWSVRRVDQVRPKSSSR